MGNCRPGSFRVVVNVALSLFVFFFFRCFHTSDGLLRSFDDVHAGNKNVANENVYALLLVGKLTAVIKAAQVEVVSNLVWCW
jgi:hypothetical protein